MSKKVMLFLFTLVCLCLIVIFIMILSANNFKPTNDNIVKPKNALPLKYENNGVTYVNGHVIVNKQLALPAKYKPGENKIAKKQLNKLLKKAEKRNLDLMKELSWQELEELARIKDE